MRGDDDNVGKFRRLHKLGLVAAVAFVIVLTLGAPGEAADAHHGGGSRGAHGGAFNGAHRGGHPAFDGRRFDGRFHRGFDGRFRGRAFVGVFPYFAYPYYGYYPYYDSAPAYTYDTPSYWYYCPSYGAYYPNVQSCPEAWQPVPAS